RTRTAPGHLACVRAHPDHSRTEARPALRLPRLAPRQSSCVRSDLCPRIEAYARARTRDECLAMINRLIDVALRNRFIVVALYLGLAGWGWWALTATPIDAIPDLSDNQVIVFTDWPGHS